MRYVSLDLETTGLDPAQHQVLQFAFVIEDTEKPEVPVLELPTFTGLVEHRSYGGSAYALAMNASILAALGRIRPLSEGNQNQTPVAELGNVVYEVFKGDSMDERFWELEVVKWLATHGITPQSKVVAAGKNVAGFDLQFLERNGELRSCFQHRVIDPGSVFLDFDEPGPLSLETLKKQYLNDDKGVAHTAVEDARDVIRVLRTLSGGVL